jgi:hypothetical protein
MNQQAAALAKASWPVDTVFPDKGEVHITGRYVYPKLSDRAALVGLAAFVVASFVIGPVGTEGIPADVKPGYIFQNVLYIAPPIGFVAAFIAYWMMRRDLNVTITSDAIRFGRQAYPRNVPIEFSVQRHRKAFEQAGKPRPNRTWIHAIEVVMRYGEARVTVAEMRERDQEKATALVIRLGNTCERFGAIMAQAAGQAEPVAAATKPAAPAAGDFGPAPDVR